VCLFSATLHSPEITKLAAAICCSPEWVDLKGPNAVPDTVHHTMLRLDLDLHAQLLLPAAQERGAADVFLDDVHEGGKVVPDMSASERDSLLVKELKQRLLVKIVDHFQVRDPAVTLTLYRLLLTGAADVAMHHFLPHQPGLRQSRDVPLFPGRLPEIPW
jgi:hypothetical protein